MHHKHHPAHHILTHAEVATQYAHDVVNGKVLACKWVKLACKRHLDDLIASQDAAYPYVYDDAKGSRPCKFIQLLPHVEGPLAPGLIHLEPWQCFLVASLFGWVKRTNGLRRYQRAYICVPRKNAKSTLLAGIMLYTLILDNERGAQVYCGAGSKKQAEAVWLPAKAMALATHALKEKFGVQVNADSIIVPATNSRFTRLIGNPGDGMSPHSVCVDEFHEHGDSRLYDAMTMGTGARTQPLVIVITTAGSNTASPCYFLQKDMEKILEGVVANPTRFAIIYTIDNESYEFNGQEFPADDWTTEESLIKANPNWGISVNAEQALIEQQEAIISSEKQNTFKTKKLDIWCFAKSGYFNVENWIRCGDVELKKEDFAGLPCVKGLDLGSQEDLAADVTVFQKMVEDPATLVSNMHYYIFSDLYVPRARAEDPTNKHYLKWVTDKHMIVTPGNEIDFSTIKNSILSDEKEYDLREISCDPYQMTLLSQEIRLESGVEVIPVQQSAGNLNIPMKWLRGMINSGRVHHNGNPAMTWCISNVISREDANENDFPRKERPENKIDGVAALLCALYRIRAVLGEEGNDQFYTYTGF